MKNFSLTTFVIYLILFKCYYSLTTDAIKSLNSLNIKKNYSKQKDDNSDDSINKKSMPSFANRGFKCVEYKPKLELKPQFCANADQECTSTGIVLMGPLKDSTYAAVLVKPGSQITCSLTNFGSKEDSNGKRCFTHVVEEKPDVSADNAEIPSEPYSHRSCFKGTNTQGVIMKQGAKGKCDKATFGDFEGTCSCHMVEFPFDQTLTSFYYPIRFNTKGKFECINAGNSKCSNINLIAACITLISTKIELKNIIEIPNDEKTVLNSVYPYFFNRWICPRESGLNVAAKFTSTDNGKTYKISCLSRNGEDCFYDENANSGCDKVNKCPESIKEFGVLDCGTEKYKSIWSDNGFNTFMRTWCKSASAWLRFDSTFQITQSNKPIGLMLLPNGLTACIPDIMKPETECLVENSHKILEKSIEYYQSDLTKLATLLTCKGKLLKKSKGNPDHWCNTSLILPNKKGYLLAELEFNLSVTEEKGSPNGNQSRKDGFYPLKVWRKLFATKTSFWSPMSNSKHIGDVDGDGIPDLIAFGKDGVYVSLGAKDGKFKDAIKWTSSFGTDQGYTIDNNIRDVIDMNGDKKADIIFDKRDAIYVALSNGAKFESETSWTTNFSKDWSKDKYPRLFVDLNNDGKPDIIGFHSDKTYYAYNKGNKFDDLKEQVTKFEYQSAWRVDMHPRFMIDINKDGFPDIVGFGYGSVYVAINKNGNSFNAQSTWLEKYFTHNDGWRVDKHPRFLIDINKDNLPDIVGFGNDAVYVSYNNGGKGWDAPKTNKIPMTNNNGNWFVDKHPRYVKDINGDGYPDLIGFGNDDVYVSLNKGGNNFEAPTAWLKGQLCYNQNWRSNHFREFSDVNGDGLQDILAIDDTGFFYSKTISNKFEDVSKISNDFAGGVGNDTWDNNKHLRIFADLNKDGLPDAIAFTDNQLVASINKNGRFDNEKIFLTKDLTSDWTNNKYIRVIADINNDGYPDFIGFGEQYTSFYISKDGNELIENTDMKISGMYTYSGLWRNDRHPRFVIDLNGDDYPDIIGLFDEEIWVSTNNAGKNFNKEKKWLVTDFTNKGGWKFEKHPIFIIDINGDYMPDLVGFFDDGVYLAMNEGIRFKKAVKWLDDFGYDQGYSENNTKFIIDVNGDKLPDAVVFSKVGVMVALNTAQGFKKPTRWSSQFGSDVNSGNWNSSLHIRTIQDVNKDGFPDLVGFHNDGVYFALNLKDKFDEAKLVSQDFGSSDSSGSWKNSQIREVRDMDGDGYPDIVAVNKTNDIVVALNRLG